ncbi:hypothetical protein B0T22DRAFT_513076 [Podospora appendiculata]|uniref:Uncharacterized protein n=1 Tax=Podospora appendiculata TaxID=314037 RepID=A0AAE1CCU4_9PEZI|nr:hypothetical protein B0T22DRAFT_513076 [Podospora appendiculata]
MLLPPPSVVFAATGAAIAATTFTRGTFAPESLAVAVQDTAGVAPILRPPPSVAAAALPTSSETYQQFPHAWVNPGIITPTRPAVASTVGRVPAPTHVHPVWPPPGVSTVLRGPEHSHRYASPSIFMPGPVSPTLTITRQAHDSPTPVSPFDKPIWPPQAFPYDGVSWPTPAPEISNSLIDDNCARRQAWEIIHRVRPWPRMGSELSAWLMNHQISVEEIAYNVDRLPRKLFPELLQFQKDAMSWQFDYYSKFKRLWAVCEKDVKVIDRPSGPAAGVIKGTGRVSKTIQPTYVVPTAKPKISVIPEDSEIIIVNGVAPRATGVGVAGVAAAFVVGLAAIW